MIQFRERERENGRKIREKKISERERGREMGRKFIHTLIPGDLTRNEFERKCVCFLGHRVKQKCFWQEK